MEQNENSVGSGTTPGNGLHARGDGDGEPAGRWMATVGLGWQRLKPVGEPFCRVAGL